VRPARHGGPEGCVALCSVCGLVVYRKGRARGRPNLPTRPEIPDAVGRELDEAKSCRRHDLLRACALMTRVALEMACQDQGAANGSFGPEGARPWAARHVRTPPPCLG
jgi:hypothetical protein